jgi:hypothetical protein
VYIDHTLFDDYFFATFGYCSSSLYCTSATADVERQIRRLPVLGTFAYIILELVILEGNKTWRLGMAGVEHAATESYLASGFSRKLGWGSKAALLIIDVCRAYFVPDSPLSLCGNEVAMRAPEGMKRLVEAAREAGVPVIWTTIEYTSPTMKDAGLVRFPYVFSRR